MPGRMQNHPKLNYEEKAETVIVNNFTNINNTNNHLHLR